ncbi:MAG: gfo/Idh/MocA family oxidoreductase [Acidobacteria bacterium]|nr:MAG: gfo/Idh/MocA family oxidoreductase [Acidobacteriota bacterium]
MKRREFIRGVIQAAGTVATTALSASQVLGANERVIVGLIGCGGRGRYVAKLMRDVPDVEFGAVCDVYDVNTASAQEWAGGRARAYKDFRKLLEQKDIDAVVIGTPDHWHAIPAVLACQAGKDVYVEKPLGHNIQEGRAMVRAARRYHQIVQAGTQQRSASHYREVARIIQSGELGDVRYVRVWNFSNRFPYGMGRQPDSAVPEGLDWDFYLGPAPLVPFNKNRFLQNYRWFWDYAGGTITDFGTHRFDTVHQIMGVDAPISVAATGNRYALNDGGEMPDVLQVTYEYPGFTLSYEACNLNGHGLGGRTPGMAYYNARDKEDRPNGEAYYGTNGALFADRIGFEIFPELKPVPPQDLYESERPIASGYRMARKQVSTTDATALHAKNFIECVRSRQKPVADVEIGHRSTIVAHLGNIAHKTRQKLHWDAAREDFKDAPEASKWLGRQARKPWDLI